MIRWVHCGPVVLTEDDVAHLTRCVELAREALEHDDEPFGSLLVDPNGVVVFEDRNRIAGGDATAHPELAVARWAAANIPPVRRVRCTVYTSGEHCPMCAAAHAWVGLGRIVYATSALQLAGWLDAWGIPAFPVAPLPIGIVAPRVVAHGPAPQLEAEMKALYEARFCP